MRNDAASAATHPNKQTPRNPNTRWARAARLSARQQRAAIEAGKPELAAFIAKDTAALLDRHLAAR